MANIASVAKRARQAEKRRARNSSYRAQLRTAKKKFLATIEAEDVEALKTLVPVTLRLYDKMVTKGIVHKNNAARNKSRIIAKARALDPKFVLVALPKPVKVAAKEPVVEEKPKAEAKAATEAKKAPAKKAPAKKTTKKVSAEKE